MPGQAVPPTRGPLERAHAWLIMGPLGHAWSVVADLAGYFARWVLQRARARLTRGL